MQIARSVQQNVPYGYGILRSGDMRSMVMPKSSPVAVPVQAQVGGFDPTAILETINNPMFQKAFKKPIDALVLNPLDKLWSWMGMGVHGLESAKQTQVGGAYRIGGFWQKSGDLGTYVQPMQPVGPGFKSSIGRGEGKSMPDLSPRDIKNLRVLEKRLMPLANDKERFMAKLLKIRAAGEGFFKKHRKLIKASTCGGESKSCESKPKKYKTSKRYKVKKARHYAKFPKSEFGKYRQHPKYSAHKVKYVTYHQKKRV